MAKPDLQRVVCGIALTAILGLPAHHGHAQQAPFFVIVHPQNPVEILSPNQIAALYDGTVRSWSHGVEVMPIDLQPDSSVRRAFSRYLVSSQDGVITAEQADARTGTILVTEGAEAVTRVMQNPGAIAYISTSTDFANAKLVPIVQPPRILQRVPPQYTEKALRFRIEGEVVMDLEIDATGAVEHVSVVEGLQFGLTKEAVKAVERWTFEPATSGGVAVAAPYRVSVKFQLGR
jgi:TonB family protein